MQTNQIELEPFVAEVARQSQGTFWYGATPSVHQGEIAGEVASKLGYPTSDFAIGEILKEIKLEEAANVLEHIAGGSLAYPSFRSAPQVSASDALLVLNKMKDGARFFTNGDWGNRLIKNSNGWTPLSAATFDAGVIGFDSDLAFIVWTEDED